MTAQIWTGSLGSLAAENDQILVFPIDVLRL